LARPSPGRVTSLVSALAVAAGAIALSVAGCTSDGANLVGTSLVTAQIDTILRPLAVYTIDDYSPSAVIDPSEPFAEAQVLYFGDQGSESSSILLNYDFSTLRDEGWIPEIVNESNIAAVKLVMLRLEKYSKLPESGGDFHNPEEKSYAAFQLEQPFAAQDYPGPVPPYNPQRLNADTAPRSTGGVSLVIDTDRFLDWYDAQESVGVMVTEGDDPGSDDGFVGYASRDLTKFSELPPEWEGTVVPPKLQVEFADTTENLIIAPYADISTFDQVDIGPTDLSSGFMLRTHLRNYPWFLFDFSQLQPNVYIQRAVLAVTNDTTRAYGPGFEAIVVAELDTTLIPAANDTLTTTELSQNVYEVSSQLSLKPWETTQLELLATTAVQRLVNDVYTGRRGLLQTGGEAFFAGVGGTGFDPAFLMQRFWFYGTDAPDSSMLPYLKITYSRSDELTAEGGG